VEVAVTAGRLAQLSLGGALLIAGAGRAQEPPSFGASTELVVIDMIATDDGQLVTDLRPDEIEVFEAGKRMPVEFLQLVLPGSGGAAPGDTSARTAPSEGRNLPVSLSLVVVVDVASLTADLLTRTVRGRGAGAAVASRRG
jgi:hypothetical protein